MSDSTPLPVSLESAIVCFGMACKFSAQPETRAESAQRLKSEIEGYARAAVAEAVQRERERCAKLCDEQHDRARTSTGAARADACAAAIRATPAKTDTEGKTE